MNLDVTPRAKLVGLQEGNDTSFTNCRGKRFVSEPIKKKKSTFYHWLFMHQCFIAGIHSVVSEYFGSASSTIKASHTALVEANTGPSSSTLAFFLYVND